MNSKLKKINPDIHFRLLASLEEAPYLTQRALAKKLGISLGGVNYCLQALIQAGHIKINNFNKSPKKLIYFYFLTPKGITEKSLLTASFLKRKMREYHNLKKEIESIKSRIKV